MLVSIASTGLRSAIGFISGLLVARGLSPSGYGDLAFLIGSFAAIRSLLDMGSSSAFYTFISQRARARGFYLLYAGWLTAQFLITLLLVTLILPAEKIWLGHSRGIVLLAFMASFMQQQVWQTITQIGEATRKTVRIHVLNTAVVVTHLILVSVLLLYYLISVQIVLMLIIGEYLAVTIWSAWFLKGYQAQGLEETEEWDASEAIKDYWRYCKPLILLSAVSFSYDFADKWMLQRFGGASQQGFYQVAYQFAAVSIIATASVLNVFWKEIAEAVERNDPERVRRLYHKVSRGLVMFGAAVSGFLIPWSQQIVSFFLGQAYMTAWPVLVVMLLYPIHQSMGQIGTAMLLASGHTRAYVVMTVATMLVTMPLSYWSQAPASGVLVGGLGLGAMGMALKMVLVGIVSVNVQAWIIARYQGWQFNWLYQVVGIGAAVGIGFLSKAVVAGFWDLSDPDLMRQLAAVCMACILYLALATALIWLMPWLIGMEKKEIKSMLQRFAISRV